MKSDLEGRVERLELKPKAEAYWPLFEALANSLESIVYGKTKQGEIEIVFERDNGKIPLGGDIKVNRLELPIRNIRVIDNGAGFNQENLQSFETLDSRHKLELGCKGVGRLYWLKAFDEVQVSSSFLEGSKFMTRQFEFKLPDGVCNGVFKDSDFRTPRTEIKLLGYKEQYEKHLRNRRLATIKQEIITHFLPVLILKNCPTIRLVDGDTFETIAKADLPPVKKESFTFRGHEFTLHHIQADKSENNAHTVYYCASNRVVDAKKLKETKKKFSKGKDKFYYIGYLTSDYLDRKVNSERNRFTFDDDDTPLLGEISLISEASLDNAVNKKVAKFLSEYLKELSLTKSQKIESVFSTDMSALSYIQHRNKAELEAIPLDASEEDIKKTIALLHYENHVAIKKQADDLLENIEEGHTLTIDRFSDSYQEGFAELMEVHQADLAQYVLYRRWVLELLKKVLSKKDNINFYKENTVHNIIFPLRKDAHGEDGFNQHNLWLINDEYAYYDYIASDQELHSHKPVKGVDSDDRPDICCYFFSQDANESSHDSIVIIELKRPGREGYAKGDNPIRQVLGYVQQLSKGARDVNGIQIQVKDSTKFYCYIICDTLNDHIEEAAFHYQLNPTVDGAGYFKNFNERTYIEVVPFKKLLGDAIKRNDIFFEKMGLGFRKRY